MKIMLECSFEDNFLVTMPMRVLAPVTENGNGEILLSPENGEHDTLVKGFLTSGFPCTLILEDGRREKYIILSVEEEEGNTRIAAHPVGGIALDSNTERKEGKKSDFARKQI